MRVLVRFDEQIDVVENVGVDDTCLPLVEGYHPYEPNEDASPLVREAALWFKTLALEAVYIDCNQRIIYWTSFVRNSSKPIVQTEIPSPTDAAARYDFVPTSAKPLFKDSTVYDFDASLKEMMRKCQEMARKMSKKSVSRDEYSKHIAMILHIYILPSITFTKQDLFNLSQARVLIDMRFSKAESDIKKKAIVIENIKKCLYNMVMKLLTEENFESENYLRTCARNFLVSLLKVVEWYVEHLNIKLSAVQNMINWGKEHPEEPERLADLKNKRDEIFQQINRHIVVRETIKNTIMRRQLTTKKVKKCKVINSTIHNLFVELVKMLELEEVRLLELGEDKVNICAAREAILLVMSDITNNEKGLDPATKFEPEKFVHYSVDDDSDVEKSDDWLTFQERVTKILADKSSVASKCHYFGCKTLLSEVTQILSQMQHIKRDTHRKIRFSESFEEEDLTTQFSLSLDDVSDGSVFSDDDSLVQRRQPVSSKQEPQLSTVMSRIDNLKGFIQAYFSGVITHLDQHLHKDGEDISFTEQQELLWKSYERFFCQELYKPLLELYTATFAPSIQQAYATISNTPVYEILQGDKLLDLFFVQSTRGRTAPIPVPSPRQVRTNSSDDQASSALSFDVLSSRIDDLYLTPNYNNNDVFPDCFGQEINEVSSYSSSVLTVLSSDEGLGSLSESIQSVSSCGSVDEDIVNDIQRCKILSNQQRITEILHPVITPFRKHIEECLRAMTFLDKVHCIAQAVEGLNTDISRMMGPDHQSACDDIISMLVLMLCNLSEEMFVGLYVNLRLLMDVLPSFLSGSLCGYILVSMFASYDYLFTLRICDKVVKDCPGIIKV